MAGPMMAGVVRNRRAADVFIGIAYGLVFAVGFSTAALAQLGALGGGGSAAPPPVATGRGDELANPGSDRTALTLDGWLLYPSGFAGVSLDSNPSQRATGGRLGVGLRLVPSMLAESATGIHKTTIYGMADGTVFSNTSNGNADTISAKAGVTEIYQPLKDLFINGQLDFTRQKDLFATFGVDSSLVPLSQAGIGLSPTKNPVSYNQITAAASAQKNFSNFFVTGSGSVVDIMYDSSNVTAPSPDAVLYTGGLRGGYWIVPALYAYAEGSVDTRRYASSSLSSSGYRIVGGLGSDQIGLFRGEVYGGFQSEIGDSAALGTVSGASFGGQLHYFPVPELTIDTSVGRTIGASLLANASASQLGTSTVVTTVLGQARYKLAKEWEAGGRAGYIHTDYVSNIRQDDAWTTGATVTYSVWQNLGLALDYQHINLSSNVPAQGFSRDVITLGVSYKY